MKVSQSQVKCYKSCRRLYDLRYNEGLRYKGEIQTLKDGTSYHEKLESLYKTGTFERTGEKADAMAAAYEKYIYPKFKVSVAEDPFETQLSDKHVLIGKVDGIAENGRLVEHKTTSYDVDEFVYNLQFDEQVLAYMAGKGVNEMYYTVCKKPTIRQKQTETEEEFIKRCVEWYDTDTENKIRVVLVKRNWKEVDEYLDTLEKTIDEMESCKLFYRNTCNCMSYGRMCEYASICLNYDPKMEYVDFEKRERE